MKTCVVMTTYNGEKYIRQQLESILNQSEQVDYIYIYDDRSTDRTVSIIRECFFNYSFSNYEININEVQLGWKENFWQGLIKAKENYIFISDQDDVWNRDKVKSMKNIARQLLIEYEEFSLITSDYEVFYEDKQAEKVKNDLVSKEKKVNKISKWRLDMKFMETNRPGCTYFVNKRIIGEISNFRSVNQPHDSIIWRYSILKGQAYNINEKLIRYRRHKESAINIAHNVYTINSGVLGTYKNKLLEDVLPVRKSFLEGLLESEQLTNLNKKSIDLVKKQSSFISWRENYLQKRKPIYSIFVWRSFYVTKKQLVGDFTARLFIQ